MTVFFTSDLHLGHPNIAAYCFRPWLNWGDYDHPTRSWTSTEARVACGERMNKGLIHNWNSRVSPEDTVYHLGDFCCKGNANGVPGVRTKAESWEAELNGKIIHIRGNHDVNNSVKCSLDMAVIEFCGLKWLLTHIPPHRREEIPDFCDAVLCGHVHEKWQWMFVEDVPVINVGVDVWNYMPITKQEVEKLRSRIVREKL